MQELEQRIAALEAKCAHTARIRDEALARGVALAEHLLAAEAERDAALARCARLEAALVRYGEHDACCAAQAHGICDCGYVERLDALKVGEP